MSNVSMESLREKTGNIYETVAIMAKRSWQINEMQRKKIDQEREALPMVDIRDSEDFEDVEIDRDALNREYTKMKKPTRLAIEQMLDDDIQYRYKSDEEA